MIKIKQVLATILCVSLLLLLLAGCVATNYDEADQESTEEPIVEQSAEENEPNIPDNEENHQQSLAIADFNAAIATFPPDTVMLRAGNITVTWAELYVFLFTTFMEMVNALGTDLDLANEDSNLADLILEHATDSAITLLTYQYGLEVMDITISEEDLARFNDDVAEIIEMYGDMEYLERNLRETGGFYDFDLFVSMFRNDYSVSFLISELYGDDSTTFTDEDIADFASENGYMMAAHILRLRYDNDGMPLEEAEAEAEDLLEQLREQENSDDFVEFFMELMHEQSEDHGGLMSFPEGYLFQHADMVQPFSDTTEELEIWGLSDVVETTFGFHIILRLPIDYNAVPIAASSAGMTMTLRQMAALEDFDALLREWRDMMDIEFTDEFNMIDIATIFVFN